MSGFHIGAYLLLTSRILITGAWKESQSESFKWLERVWLSGYFSRPLLFATAKLVTVANTAFFENHNSLRSAFKIIPFKPKAGFEPIPQLPFCWERYKTSGVFLYCLWPFHTRTHECLHVEVKVCGLSCWEWRSHQGPHGLTPDISGHKTDFPLSRQPQSSCYCELHHLSTLNRWLKQWRLWAHGAAFQLECISHLLLLPNSIEVIFAEQKQW